MKKDLLKAFLIWDVNTSSLLLFVISVSRDGTLRIMEQVILLVLWFVTMGLITIGMALEFQKIREEKEKG